VEPHWDKGIVFVTLPVASEHEPCQFEIEHVAGSEPGMPQ
jgi:hypothetical protein